VLEDFYGNSNGQTHRYHVGDMESIELITEKSRKHFLVMRTKFHTRTEQVADKAPGKTQDLVAEVRRVMQSTAFVLYHEP